MVEWNDDSEDESAIDGTIRLEPPALAVGDSIPLTGLREANLIVIAHPQDTFLGRRFRLIPGTAPLIGRDPAVDISLPEVQSVSRHHAVLRYDGRTVRVEDRNSTNGTWVRGRRITSRVTLKSGDRFQVGMVHFKLLHELDLEHAYHEAIYELAIKDGLTGVFNRRKFEEHGGRECARALRHKRPLALILFDLDGFKIVNDRRGHVRGDAVLAKVAAVAQDVLRADQLLARLGGDEFAVVCEETRVDGALGLAERLRAALEAEDHSHLGAQEYVTASFGVAAFEPPMTNLSELVHAADQAQYRSKQEGRNRVSAYRP